MRTDDPKVNTSRLELRKDFHLLIEHYDPAQPDRPYEEYDFYRSRQSVPYWKELVWQLTHKRLLEEPMMTQYDMLVNMLGNHTYHDKKLYHIGYPSFERRYRKGGEERLAFLKMTGEEREEWKAFINTPRQRQLEAQGKL